MSETSEWVTDSFTHVVCSKKLNHPRAKQHSVLLEDAFEYATVISGLISQQ